MATIRYRSELGELGVHYPTGYPDGSASPGFPEITGPPEYRLNGEPIEEDRGRELVAAARAAAFAEEPLP